MTNLIDKLDYLFIGVSTLISVQDIHNILSIIILCINALWLICKFGLKVHDYVVNHDYKGIQKAVDELNEDVNKLKGGKDGNNK